MKRIVSVSLGTSKRDYSYTLNILGENYHIERIGSNGSFNNAIRLIKELDGKIDAFGIGGIDLFLQTGSRKYILRDALKLKKAAKNTPLYDGSKYKYTFERNIIYKLMEDGVVDFKNKSILVTSALDRYGMTEALEKCGGKIIIGDMLFALNCNIPIYSLSTLNKMAMILLPIVSRLPFRMIYPTGGRQFENKNRFNNYYINAEIIAGDFHYIKRYMPMDLKNKIIITNTVTKEDIIQLKTRGVKLLVTTTPKLGERSFGTNVMEALIETIINNSKFVHKKISYEDVYRTVGLEPRIEHFIKL
ncbi:quinate 5-dehydrogenase [Serpentinicella alkaliphila]|uniref:Quinate 5-dehydrogenase n=1 Tax=Serpentinicella alkaliphila TaxID=1734049 RepID=A0A4R2TH74_9FIRM|nr:quinate 5-dehydrogenase [Serpentinicella alkaliphila]QUH25376.1 quinate 5-dehydrogenase [Serpentinicella alkaliphila]TCQ01552.1 hypothetical protein EDD79_102615 [Serpentinicella alkaliphila]